MGQWGQRIAIFGVLVEAERFAYLRWEFSIGVGRTYAIALAGRAEIYKDEKLVCVIATSELFTDRESLVEDMRARCMRWADSQTG